MVYLLWIIVIVAACALSAYVGTRTEKKLATEEDNKN